MHENRPISARIDASELLPWRLMDTNEHLRQRVLRLIKAGVSQKILAARMGMKESTFSRWLNKKEGINPASVRALDGLEAYVQELAAALTEGAQITTAGAAFWDGEDRRKGADRRVAANDT